MFSEIKIKQGSIDYKLILSHYPQLMYLNVEIYKCVNIYLNNTILMIQFSKEKSKLYLINFLKRIFKQSKK